MSDTLVSPEVFAQSLSAKVLHCRELGHNWRPWTVSLDRKSHAYDRVLRCPSCTTERHQVLNAYGQVLSNRYVYPSNYLTAGKVERGTFNRDVFRLEAVSRWLDTHDMAKAG
jgi:hypothetical protein